jgi:hypothetical protein
LSEYKYIVAKLGSNNNADVEFKLFDGNNYWGSSTSSKFGSSQQVIVNLKSVKKGDNTLLEPGHIYIAGFWSNGNAPFIIDTVFLSIPPNTILRFPPLMSSVENLYRNEFVDVYSIMGIKVRSQIKGRRRQRNFRLVCTLLAERRFWWLITSKTERLEVVRNS